MVKKFCQFQTLKQYHVAKTVKVIVRFDSVSNGAVGRLDWYPMVYHYSEESVLLFREAIVGESMNLS